ncbi:MAG: hypothetical protein ABL996_02905 [Micropepsaceae bacterium]
MSPWILLLAAAVAVPPAQLPASMIGVWGWNEASCANPDDDGRVNVEPASVTFYAASYRLKSILTEADQTIQATGVVQEEGLEDDEQDKSEHAIRLKLTSPSHLWIGTDNGLERTYLRCKV